MKRRLTVSFRRAITKLSERQERIEVTLTPLSGQSSSAVDETYLPQTERREFVLRDEVEKVAFDVIPSNDPAFKESIPYRIAWRRGYLGKLETHDFLMPDKDVTLEDILSGESADLGVVYLSERDLGVPGRVARLSYDGKVLDAESNELATVNDVEETTQDAETRVQERLRSSLGELRDTLTTQLNTTEESLREELEKLLESLPEETALTEEDLRPFLEKKADLVEGVVPESQLPTGIRSKVHKVTSDRLLTSTQATRGDIAVTPTNTWFLNEDNPTVQSSWVSIATPFDGVETVNGKKGEVTLTAQDVGARVADGKVDLEDIEGYVDDIRRRLTPFIRVDEEGEISSSSLKEDVPLYRDGKLVTKLGEEIKTAGDVTSVNGETGEVEITAESLGARRVDVPLKIAEVENLQNNLNLKVGVSDARLTDSRTPTQHADSHKKDGSDPLLLSQSQIDGLTLALDGKATKEEFQSFRTSIEESLPDNPEQHETAAREFASLSHGAAVESTDSAQRAEEALTTFRPLFETFSEKELSFSQSYESFQEGLASVESTRESLESLSVEIEGSREEIVTAVSTVSEDRQRAEVAATALLARAVAEGVITEESDLQTLLESVKSYLGTEYRDRVEEMLFETRTTKDEIEALTSNFQTNADLIRAKQDEVTTAVKQISDLKTLVDGKASTSHKHVSSDISDAVSAPVASTLVMRDSTGAFTVTEPEVGAHPATKTFVEASVKSVSDSLEEKAPKSHQHTLADITDLPNSHTAESTANTLVSRDAAGRVRVEDPVANKDAVNRSYLLAQLVGYAAKNHVHDFKDLTGRLDNEDMPAVTSLGASVDLNTVEASGTYHQGSNASATTTLNYPEALAGLLTVVNPEGTTMVYQEYVTYGTTSRVWRRGKYNASWSTWVAQTPSATTWTSITGKPSTFTPSTHTHTTSQVTGLDAALSGKAAKSHTHAVGEVTGLQAALDKKLEAGHTHTMSNLTDWKGYSTSATNGNTVPVRASNGDIPVPNTPGSAGAATSKAYVDARTPKVSVVTSLPSTKDPNTLYVVTG